MVNFRTFLFMNPGSEMNDFQSGKTHNINKRFPGCLGITMNLFDVSAGLAAGSTKLLIDKPHHDGDFPSLVHLFIFTTSLRRLMGS